MNKEGPSIKEIWEIIKNETEKRVQAEPVLASFFHSTILEHDSFSSAVADLIASDLGRASVQPMLLRSVIKEAMNSSEEILSGTVSDLLAAKERDPSCKYLSEPFLFFKELIKCANKGVIVRLRTRDFGDTDFNIENNIKYENIPNLCNKFNVKKNLINPIYKA